MNNEVNIPLEEDGIEEEILVDEEVAVTKAMWGDIGGNIENQTDLQDALDAKQDSLTEAQLNAVNSGITSEKVTTYDGYADQIARKADQSALDAESITRGEADTALGRRIDDEATARQNADNGLQTQIDAITSKSDVVDVVANYAALQAYDTSSLGNNDVVKVLDDETHEDALTYYRWSTATQTWSYIGQEAPYYSKGQMDVMLQGKQDKLTAGANIQIQNGTISATDTTYTNGYGLKLEDGEFSADTDVLATKDDLDGYYTKPETDNLLAPKLEAEVVAEIPTAGEEGKLYLTPKAHTTQTATGNPITATVAEEAGKIESFQLDGDTEQTTYTGKNLFDIEQYSNAILRGGGVGVSLTKIDSRTLRATNLVKQSNNFCGIPVPNYTELLGETVTVSGSITRHDVPNTKIVFAWNISGVSAFGQNLALSQDGTFILTQSIPASAPSGATGLLVVIYANGEGNNGEVSSYVDWSDIQLEKSSTATSFEPYVGGVPSPNPSYPQDINAVTGTQTISINGTNYPISLGSLELCKLGTYKDYIYKDGEDWKAHKATAIASASNREWEWANMSPNGWYFSHTYYGFYDINKINVISKSFIGVKRSVAPNTSGAFITMARDGSIGIRNPNITGSSNVTQFTDWLNSLNTTWLYARTTPTDTTITDTTLIAQLEAIRTASLQNGTNTITNTATGSNLAGDMEIGYYGFAPRNRYDKWLWLDINNEYEQIGS